MRESCFHIELLLLISHERERESTEALRPRRWRDSGSTKRGRMQFQSSCSAMYGDVSDRVGCRNSIEARAISRVQNHKPRRLNTLLGQRVHGGWSQMEPWEAKFCLVAVAKYG